MKNEGYVPIWRKLRENPLWTEDREFSKLEAWIDILLEVQHKDEPCETLLGFDMIVTTQAESCKSLVTWGKRWNWSKSKVKRFFVLLKNMGMISFTNEKITTRLKVLNYRHYKDLATRERSASVPPPLHDRSAIVPQASTDNNVKNVKNVENDKKSSPKIPQGDDCVKPWAPLPDSIEALEYFNRLADTDFKPVKSQLQFIQARLKDQYKLEDIKKVIYWVVHTWPDDVYRARFYPRTDTPFRPQKFPQNLQAAKKWWANGKRNRSDMTSFEKRCESAERVMREILEEDCER